MARKRYSAQKQQEQISRKQFESFLEQHEWITGDVEPDLGEDILVRIYRDGISTGLSLYIQLKSVKSIADHQLKTGEISFKFDLDDLFHWEVQTPTVFIVIWDVTQRMGWWISITDAIQYLDLNNQGWRNNNSSAKIHIPFENRMDHAGLNKIRSTLAGLYGPVIAKGKEIVIKAKFLFPATPEGREKGNAMKRTMAAGEPIELDGQYIHEFTLPDWWTRIHGTPDPKEMVLWIGSAPSEEILPLQFEFQSDNIGKELIPYVELKMTKQGYEETTLSNDHQSIPFKIIMVANSKSRAFTLTVHSDCEGLDGQTALKVMNLEKIYANGGSIHVLALKTGHKTQYPIPPGSHPPPDPRFLKFVENLAVIQQRTGRPLRIPDFASLTFEQMREAQELAAIVTDGRYIRTPDDFSIEFLRPGVGQLIHLPRSGNLYLRVEYADVVYDLLGEQFELGPCIRTIHGKLTNPYDEITAWYEQAGENGSYKIKLATPEITDEYPNWTPLETR